MHRTPKQRNSRINKRFKVFVLLGCISTASVFAQEHDKPLQAKISVPPFEANEHVVFIGDSITHAGTYHANIALFYALRFANQNINFINAGISGDTASGTNARFSRDIAIHRPSHATVMLGMNDVERERYASLSSNEKASTHFLQEQEEIRKAYLNEQFALVSRLLDLGTHVTLIGPSIYDQTMQAERQNMFGVNDELAVFSKQLERLALTGKKSLQSADVLNTQQLSFVDFQLPMLSINMKMQSKNPRASVVGEDRIHPGEFGHFVMTHTFLAAQFDTSTVATLSFDAEQQSYEVENCETQGNILITTHSLDYSCILQALPFPLNDAQTAALDYLDFQPRFNRLILRINDLEQGEYTLTVNETNIATFSSSELAKGVSLSDYAHAPFYKQAERVKAFNEARVKSEKALRDVLQVRFSMLDHYPDVDLSDKEAVKSTLIMHIEKSKEKPWYAYLQNQVKHYLANAHLEEEYRQQARQFNQKMYQASAPQTYRWRLSKFQPQ